MQFNRGLLCCKPCLALSTVHHPDLGSGEVCFPLQRCIATSSERKGMHVKAEQRPGKAEERVGKRNLPFEKCDICEHFQQHQKQHHEHYEHCGRGQNQELPSFPYTVISALQVHSKWGPIADVDLGKSSGCCHKGSVMVVLSSNVSSSSLLRHWETDEIHPKSISADTGDLRRSSRSIFGTVFTCDRSPLWPGP